MKNDLGQLQAKLNLNIEAEPATPTPAATVVGAPTFTEKPKIETLEGGKRVQMIVRYKAEAQCQCEWFFKETKVVSDLSYKIYTVPCQEDHASALTEAMIITSDPRYIL